MWFKFMDMYSGGARKLDWDNIYLEAESEQHATEIFELKFGRDPNYTTCDCYGPDYSVSSADTLEHVTAWDRGLRYIRPTGPRAPANQIQYPTRGDDQYLEPDEDVPEGFELTPASRIAGFDNGLSMQEFRQQAGDRYCLIPNSKP